MDTKLNRRDFLKLAGAMSLGSMGFPLTRILPKRGGDAKNILILVFDALSARHISLLGYSRSTMPNLSELANRAVVYHNHYSGGNFTTPGTASLLTGASPLKHRAFRFFDTVSENFSEKSVFHVFDDYYKAAYSHNLLVETLLDQFSPAIDRNIPVNRFLLTTDNLIDTLFPNDPDTASVAWSRIIKKEENYSYSLFASDIYNRRQKGKVKNLRADFPRGLPRIKSDNYFVLETIIDWLGGQLRQFPQPFLGYFHFLPPHYPYATHADFYDRFLKDGLFLRQKPEDIFTQNTSEIVVENKRRQYDEFILYADRELGRLFKYLETSGILDDTWVIITSDHGELFERGITGHVTPVLYEPVIRIPLLIFAPGQRNRVDVYEKTSALDILPTLAHLTGRGQISWAEGTVLPPFSSTNIKSDRSIYVVQSATAEKNSALTTATVALIKEDYKLQYFTGYAEIDNTDRVELYNVKNDPDEVNDLYRAKPETAKELLEELKNKLKEENKPYQQ